MIVGGASGYVAAIRAVQPGLKTMIIEREHFCARFPVSTFRPYVCISRFA